MLFLTDWLLFGKGRVRLNLDGQGQGGGRILDVDGQGGGRSWKLENFMDVICVSFLSKICFSPFRLFINFLRNLYIVDNCE